MPRKPQKKKTETLQQHALRLVGEMGKCPCPLCVNCIRILFEELEPLIKTCKIELPECQKGKEPHETRNK